MSVAEEHSKNGLEEKMSRHQTTACLDDDDHDDHDDDDHEDGKWPSARRYDTRGRTARAVRNLFCLTGLVFLVVVVVYHFWWSSGRASKRLRFHEPTIRTRVRITIL
jgi:hypothetical protein